MDGADSYREFTRQGSNGRHYATVRGYVQEVPAYWAMLTALEIAALANGCGLAGWPGWLRWLLTAISVFDPPATVHDVEWHKAICAADINASNARFWRNCLRLSTGTLPHVALPLRLAQFLWLLACAVLFRLAVGIGGIGAKRHLRKNPPPTPRHPPQEKDGCRTATTTQTP